MKPEIRDRNPLSTPDREGAVCGTQTPPREEGSGGGS
jgi:hypothetical protein